VPRITPATMDQLAAYDWPGNVRELQNAVERAVILSQGGPLRFDLVVSRSGGTPPAIAPAPSQTGVLTQVELKRRERENLTAALQQTGGKIFGPDGAAELLGMKPTTLASRIAALGLERKPAVAQK